MRQKVDLTKNEKNSEGINYINKGNKNYYKKI
jgi:hypothetical protein